VQDEKIGAKSISKHPTDHRWNLSENNFFKTPARPRTQTVAAKVPDSVFQSIYKDDLDNILVFIGLHRQFDTMEGRNGERILHAACSSGQIGLTIFFLDKGAKLQTRNGEGETPLYVARDEERSDERAKDRRFAPR